MAGNRVLYGGPTVDQLDHFWEEVLWLLDAPITAGHYRINRSRHTLTVPGSRQRLRAKTVWIPTISGETSRIPCFWTSFK